MTENQIIFIVVLAIFICAIAAILTSCLTRCKHSWICIKKYTINNNRFFPETQKEVGIGRIYECEYCKKLKEESIMY